VVSKPPPADGFRLQRAEQWLRQELGANRAVSIVVRAARPSEDRPRPVRDLLARRVEIAVELASGEYLTVETAGELLNRIFGIPIGFVLSAVAALVTGLAIVGVVRETRPLRRLAVAVDRFGVEARPDPLPERGAPEVRSVIRATNAMQARISVLLRNQSLMIGAIAHDLRTYLTRLRLRLESIPDGERREKAVRDVEDMHALIEDALAFARGAFAEAPMAPVELRSLLEREVEERRLAGADAAFAAAAAPVAIQGNAADLARAFGNLIDNAIKYGDAAVVTLTLVEGQAVVTVDDRGPGIPLEEREQVFEPFRQLDAARNRDRGGAGLGLAIARQVIERHRGAIAIEDASRDSSGRGGARFRVTLPR
jgi:signal transduction histidine kinase